MIRLTTHLVSCILLALPAASQSLPPIYEKTPSKLMKASLRAELPANTFLENITTAPDGQLYITSHLDGRILRLGATGKPLEFARIDGKLAGIAAFPDGGFLLSGWTKEEKAALFKVDRAGQSSVLTLIDGGMFLNGIAHWRGNEFFVADSYRGAIYLVNGQTGRYSVWLASDALVRASTADPTPGVNGLKVFGGALYASNSAKQQLLRISIESSGKPGTVRVVSSPNNLDDFAFDSKGNLYGATHIYNSVVMVTPDGKTTVVADIASGAAGSTALTFGRTSSDRTKIYVVTNGGMSLPPAGGVQTAKVIALSAEVDGYQVR
ncbi:MAG: gluconolactonase [Bryobacteraceae bacterium]|nr:gluconolactonase [Bryobacteraceae bacterium]